MTQQNKIQWEKKVIKVMKWINDNVSEKDIELDTIIAIAREYNMMGNIYKYYLTDNNKAIAAYGSTIEYFQEVINRIFTQKTSYQCNSFSFFNKLALFHRQLGLAYWRSNNETKANENFRKAIDYESKAGQHKDNNLKNSYLIRISFLNLFLKEYDLTKKIIIDFLQDEGITWEEINNISDARTLVKSIVLLSKYKSDKDQQALNKSFKILENATNSFRMKDPMNEPMEIYLYELTKQIMEEHH